MSGFFLCVSTGCMDVLLIRMCRAYNPINNTLLFDGKFATAHLFKALGESTLSPSISISASDQLFMCYICVTSSQWVGSVLMMTLLFFLFFLKGCDDLVNAVFDLAKSLSRIQMSEEEMALFSAAVLLSPGKIFFFNWMDLCSLLYYYNQERSLFSSSYIWSI